MLLPVRDSQIWRAALAYAGAGWEVYPIWSVDKEGICTCSKRAACEDPGKHPATARGFKDASSNPERIREMFSRLPEPSIGLRTGRGSGIVALDQDPRHGGFDSLDRLEAEHDELPDTRLHYTGGGGVHSPDTKIGRLEEARSTRPLHFLALIHRSAQNRNSAKFAG
jgi:hypothetical protein